jgi:hypothetical protein
VRAAATGGFALRGTAASYDQVVASFGRDRALALWQWTEAELAAMGELSGDAFRRLGSLRLAADAEEREDLRDEIEALWADGLEAEWIDAPEALCGPLHGGDSAIRPTPRSSRRAWCGGLAARAVEAGAEISRATGGRY